MQWWKCKIWLLGAVMVALVGCTESSTVHNSTVDQDTEVDAAADAGTDTAMADDAGTDADATPDAGTDALGDVAPNCVEDHCGVCDDDPTNDCVQDCNGDWGGTATLDHCGTCDSDPSNDCVQDCAGTWGGTAQPDHCGVCDDDPSNDCVQDCNGDWGGTATEDACGTCDDDPSNDCDCAGTPGGNATVDHCGTCDADPTNDCVQDCNGDWGGTATLDGCGTCDSDPSNDCVNDCNGVPGGTATLDHCGTCDSDPTNDCIQDCAGTWGGSATTDHCGTCDADPSNDCVKDCAGTWGGSATTDHCGTCDADPSNDCVQDCNGDWAGTATLDVCGRCVGGNTGATACPTVELSPVADATVEGNEPDSNFGQDQTLTIFREFFSATARVYLRFDLSSLPANAVVQGVKLQALAYSGYAHGGDGNVYTRFVADDSWGEQTITWNNAPAADTTDLGHWWLWYNHTPSDQLGVNDSSALASVVQREYEGDGKLSLRLHSPGYDTNYRSREYSNAAQRPKLVVGYLVASTTTLEPSADAWVDSSPANHGSDQILEISPYSGSRRVYLRFDLSSLPAGAKIVKATLTMTAYTGYAPGGDGNVYTRLVSDDSWTENGIDGTNAPSAGTDNLGYWWLWYDGTPADKTGTFTTPELRDAVQAEFDGDGKISLRLHSPGYITSYRSREYSNANQRPQLTLKYVIP